MTQTHGCKDRDERPAEPHHQVDIHLECSQWLWRLSVRDSSTRARVLDSWLCALLLCVYAQLPPCYFVPRAESRIIELSAWGPIGRDVAVERISPLTTLCFGRLQRGPTGGTGVGHEDE